MRMPSKRIPTTCPTCGETRMLRPADARRAKQCRRCHLTQIAPLGWQGLKAKHGPKAAVRVVQQYRLAHPSDLEQTVIDHLDALGATYEREAWFETGVGKVYLLDFSLPGQRVIEVNGVYSHSHHQERDRRKLAALRDAGYTVLVLNDDQVKNGVREHLIDFI